MKPNLVHTSYKVTMTRNGYGDYIATASTGVNCYVREITGLNESNPDHYQESSAIFWFNPDEDVSKGDVFQFGGTHYRVERLVEARRLRTGNIQFKKCYMRIYGQIS